MTAPESQVPKAAAAIVRRFLSRFRRRPVRPATQQICVHGEWREAGVEPPPCERELWRALWR